MQSFPHSNSQRTRSSLFTSFLQFTHYRTPIPHLPPLSLSFSSYSPPISPTCLNLRYWALIVLAKEVIETGLQIINVVDYAGKGYSSSSLYLYFAMIALNAAVWWMLTLPRTIRVVRGILMLNAFISAFYGLFPIVYFMVNGVGGILLPRGNVAAEGLSEFSRQSMVISAAREAFFGGSNFVEVARKVLFRLFPLFLSISAIEDLTGLEFYLKEADTKSSQVAAIDATQKRDDNSITTSDRAAPRTTTTRKRTALALSRAADRMSRDLAKSHRHLGLPTWKVLPAIVIVLTLVIAMCGRLASLNENCRYSHRSNVSGGRLQEHWVGRWCLYQAYPLLSELPGSPSECACAVLWVRGGLINVTETNPPASKRGPCDQDALTQLHDDITHDDRHIAKYLQTLIHECPTQNATETGNILATKKLESVTVISLVNPGGASSNITDGGVEIQLQGLPQKLLVFAVEDMPVSNPSATAFDNCTDLVALYMTNVGWTNIPTGALRPLVHLVQLRVYNNHLTQLPDLSMNTALVGLDVYNNRLTQLPNLSTNTALVDLYASGNRLLSWPRSLERLTRLEELSMHSNRLTNIPAPVDRLPRLKFLDVSNNTITSLDTLAATVAVGGEAAAQSGRNETMLLLGRNPVCANGRMSGSAVLGAKWFVSCQSQCSSTCPSSIPWKPAGVTDWRGDGACEIECNTTSCSFDGGDCLK